MIFSDVSKRINKDFMKGAMGQMMTTPPTEDKPSDAELFGEFYDPECEK